jgi:outer membrane protein OmpA-like peptidoglycan-associated protein
LIRNSGFEEVETCPDGLRQLDRARHWQRANAGTPELFHACGFTKEIKPFEGEGMAGLILFTDYDNGVEYLQIELADSLSKGQKYCFSYYIYVDQKTPIIINKIGAYFSKERLYTPNWDPFRKFPQVKEENLIQKLNHWQHLQNTFIAKGGERFLTFGNFYPDYLVEEKLVGTMTESWVSYYYLDNFELKAINYQCDDIVAVQTVEEKAILTWEHSVYFDSDKATFSAAEQDRLLVFLNQLPNKINHPIKVLGHTDADASFEYNYELSQRRAQNVEAYLQQNGKRNTFLSWSGEKSPLNGNLTNLEKAANRRVEIIIDNK